MPRLDLLIAHNTGLSRRVVVRIIRAGRVRDAQGNRVTDAKLGVAPADLPRDIFIDDELHTLLVRFDCVQHKPRGVVTALRDDRHPTAYALLADAPLCRHLRAVGRLDLDSSGLLIWTTDGTWVHRLAQPRYAVPRTYQVALSGSFGSPPDDLVLDDGHRPRIRELATLEPGELHPALHVPAASQSFASITVTTGRFHEVKRIFAALNAQVLSLCRVAYGPLTLPLDLAAGDFVPVDLRAHFRGLAPAADAGGDPSSERPLVAIDGDGPHDG